MVNGASIFESELFALVMSCTYISFHMANHPCLKDKLKVSVKN